MRSPSRPPPRPPPSVAWRWAFAAAAVLAAITAVCVTLKAGFLAHPGWLAVQKADFILGPVLVGVYWLQRRPRSRFGPILIAFGFIGAIYVLQSSANGWAFSAGLISEDLIGLATYVVLLTFPTGRLDGLAARLILAAQVVVAVIPAIATVFLLPQAGAGASISGCRTLCPTNEFAITSQPAVAEHLLTIFRYGVIATALATAALLIWRFATGTGPQRRALAIGTPVALVFLLFVVAFHLLALVAPDATGLRNVVAWGIVAARAAIWYGFLASLIAAELFAARALQRLVRESLRRPSPRELETMLREPLGDPRLRLAFWKPDTRSWTAVDGENGVPWPASDAGLELTVVEQGGIPAVAILHDAQLDDDPELLQTAGSVALLAAENAELDAASTTALRDLQESRARIVGVGEAERHKVERDLHDGVQQRLIAIGIDLELTADGATPPELQDRMREIGSNVDEALRELRTVAGGIYPRVLRAYGLAAALESVQLPEGGALAVRTDGVGRYAPDVESAVYYCCLEAIQNATKHGGPGVRIVVDMRQDDHRLTFEVTDDGPGFDPATRPAGTGVQNMRDRIDALGGGFSIVTAPGDGTKVAGTVPLPVQSPAPGVTAR